MAGLLDGIDPQTALLLGLGSGLLGTTGQGRRATFGEALANGMQAGTQGYRQAIGDRQRAEQLQAEQAAREQLMRLQMEEAARAQGRFGMEQKQFSGQQAEQARKMQEAQQMRELAMRFAKGAPQMALEQGAQAGSVGPTNANADRLQAAPNAAGYDFNGYADALAGVNPVAALQMKDALRKEVPAGVVVPEGARLADPRTGREMFANPKTDKPDPLQFVDAGDFQIGYDRNGREVVRVPKGMDPTKAPKPQDVPAQIVTSFNENRASLDKVTRAIDMVQKSPGSFGLTNYLGDGVMQRLDPNGVDVRAIVADIGSLKIHDRSGAAVSASEFPRLKPFIPSATDTPETVVKKLTQFRGELEAVQREVSSAYSPGNNFKPMIGQQPQSSPASPSAPAGKVASAADIAHTLRQNPGMTRQQLVSRLEAAGYTINDPMYRRQGGASGGY